MCWEGKYYYDKVLPFGLRSAPSIFNQLSDALEWILLNKCNISFACHILDDITHTTADSQGGQEKPALQETWVGPRQTAASPQSFYITRSRSEGW